MPRRRRLNGRQYTEAPAAPPAPTSSGQTTSSAGFENGAKQSVSNAFPTTTSPSSSKAATSAAASVSTGSPSGAASKTTTTTTHHSGTTVSSSTSSTVHGRSSSSLVDPTSSTALPSSSLVASADNKSPNSISGSAIGAIVAIIVIIICGVAAYFFVKRQQKRKGMANNRLTRFSLSPTYNATAGPGPEPTFGNNAPPAMAAPYPFNNSGYNASMAIQQEKPPPPPPPPALKAGPVPSTVVTPPLTLNVAVAPTAAIAADTIFTPIADTAPPSWLQEQPIGTYPVLAGYTPTLSDEILLRPGDQVQVLVEYDDGWCMGTNLSAGQQKGVFPKHCITPPATEQQPQQPQQPPSDVGPALNFMANTAAAQKRASSLVGPGSVPSLYQ